jgi:hypothetical protein
MENKNNIIGLHQWLMLVTLATQKAEISRITAWSQPRQIICLSWKNPSQKRAGGVAQAVGHKLKPQYHKKTKQNQKQKNNNNIIDSLKKVFPYEKC